MERRILLRRPGTQPSPYKIVIRGNLFRLRRRRTIYSRNEQAGLDAQKRYGTKAVTVMVWDKRQYVNQ